MPEHRARLRDNIPLTTRRFTPEGFLVAKAAVTRTGIINYNSADLGLPGPSRQVKVMRTADSVFHSDTLQSIRAAVLTLNHPDERITPETWNDVSVGNVVGEPSRLDDSRVGADIIIRDQTAIRALDGGTEDISIGYDFAIRDASPDIGYDYVSSGPLSVEHMALVPTGRAGKDVRVFDQKEQGMGLSAEEIKQVADTVAMQVKGLKDSAADTDTVAAQVQAAMKPVLDSIEKLNKDAAERETAATADAAKAKAKDAADKLVAETIATERKRAAVLTDALPMIPEAKREAIKNASVKDILVAAVGDAVPNAADQSEDYLKGIVDGMAKNRRDVQVTRAGQASATVTDADSAYDAMVKSLETAYINEKGD